MRLTAICILVAAFLGNIAVFVWGSFRQPTEPPGLRKALHDAVASSFPASAPANLGPESKTLWASATQQAIDDLRAKIADADSQDLSRVEFTNDVYRIALICDVLLVLAALIMLQDQKILRPKAHQRGKQEPRP